MKQHKSQDSSNHDLESQEARHSSCSCSSGAKQNWKSETSVATGYVMNKRTGRGPFNYPCGERFIRIRKRLEDKKYQQTRSRKSTHMETLTRTAPSQVWTAILRSSS